MIERSILENDRVILKVQLLVTPTMPIAELLKQTRFLTNNLGEQTDAVIPIDAWNDVIAFVESVQSIDEAHWIHQAQQARRDSEMIGTDRFTQEIIRLAALDESKDA